MIREKKKPDTIFDTIARQIAENEQGLYSVNDSKNPIKLDKEVAYLHRLFGIIPKKEAVANRVAALHANPKTRPAWNKGIKYEKQSKRKGVLSPFWKGGISSEMDLIRQSPPYKAWRKAVYERDNYTCVFCGARQSAGNPVKLNADHIKPFAYFPDLRYDVDNGRTLCVPCHTTTETFGSKLDKQEKLFSKP
jgi:HNH endonuclease